MIYPEEFESYWEKNKAKFMKEDSLLSEKVVKALEFEKWQETALKMEDYGFPSFYRRVRVSYRCPHFRENKCTKVGSKFEGKDCPFKGEMNDCEEAMK